MDRILIFGMTETQGGVESFLMNYYRHMDRDKIQFDFLCNTHHAVACEEEIRSLGGCVYHITARKANRKKFYQELDTFFQDHARDFCAIWVNVCSLANIDYLKYAKKYQIPRRIIHSHNSKNMDGFLRGLLHCRNRKIIREYATDFWACSEEAADWFYEGITREKAVLINNAIPVEKYRFSEEKREAYRRLIGWEKNFVIGNIGRLHFQKNQEFILDVFAELLKSNPAFRLVLVGSGEDEKKLKDKARKEKLDPYIYWAGAQEDIQGWLSAFDLFLFPSLFEGLSIAALEAQANGVICLASEKVIPEKLQMNENFYFMSLKQNAVIWAKWIEVLSKESRTRIAPEKVKENFRKYGFDINTQAELMREELLR